MKSEVQKMLLVYGAIMLREKVYLSVLLLGSLVFLTFYIYICLKVYVLCAIRSSLEAGFIRCLRADRCGWL